MTDSDWDTHVQEALMTVYDQENPRALPFTCCPHCGCQGEDAQGHHIPCSAGCNDTTTGA